MPRKIKDIEDKTGALFFIGISTFFRISGAKLIAGTVPSQKVIIDVIPRIGLLNDAITKTTP